MGNHIADAKNNGSYQEGIVDLAGLESCSENYIKKALTY
jgi:hypothetical protein